MGKTAGCFSLLARDVSSQLQPATLLEQVLILKLRCNENVPTMSCLSIRRPWMTLQVWPRAVQPFQGGIQLILQFYNFHIFQSGVRSVHLTSGSRHLGGLPEKHWPRFSLCFRLPRRTRRGHCWSIGRRRRGWRGCWRGCWRGWRRRRQGSKASPSETPTSGSPTSPISGRQSSPTTRTPRCPTPRSPTSPVVK